MSYILDANVFIQAKNQYYGLDFFPGFWQWLTLNGESGKVLTLSYVRDEIVQEGEQEDGLSVWARTEGSAVFKPIPKTELELFYQHMKMLSQWVNQHDHYQTLAKNNFLGGADGPLIAYAAAQNHVVVTHEKSEPNSKNSIKIPDVCRQFNVECINTFDMLRREKVRFVLENC